MRFLSIGQEVDRRHGASGARAPRHEDARNAGGPAGESASWAGDPSWESEAYDLMDRWYCMTARGAQITTIAIAQRQV